MIFLSLVLFGVAHLLGATMPEQFNLGPNVIFDLVDPAAWRSLPSANLTALFIQTVGTPLFLWVYAATSVKRLHDRDKSGWWMIPFFVAARPLQPVWRSAWRLDWPMGGDAVRPCAPFVFSVWGFVEMYCLKGTTRAQPVRPRPAGAATQAMRPRLGPAKRAGICPRTQRWPIAGSSC